MSVSSFLSSDKFVIRIIKSLSTNPDNEWANSYEFRATGAGTETDLLALGTALVNFEAEFHFSTVIFQRLLISTWAPDSSPYDPEAFISTTLTAGGGVAAAADPLPLNACLHVSRQCATGRFGHLFYRACLTEADVVAPAGKSVLVDRPAKQSQLEASIAAGDLTDYLGSGTPTSLVMALVGASSGASRDVMNLRVSGVSYVKPDHKWFNRT